MSASFYLFNVNHGLCAAMRLPNGRWCIFDAGCTNGFSPITWLAKAISAPRYTSPIVAALAIPQTLSVYKATISHLHCDHLDDYATLFKYGPSLLRTVDPDAAYLADCKSTCADGSWAKVCGFLQHRHQSFGPTTTATTDYGGAAISELSLPVDVARSVGGDANARVNNASVVTRIDMYGNSILLCGDVEKEAWQAIIADTGVYGRLWRPFLSNVDILVAPHHGHRSGYSVDLLDLAKPSVVLVSATSRDEHVESRYSGAPVQGIRISWPNGSRTDHSYISTRDKGHIRVDIQPPVNPLLIGAKGQSFWTFGDAALTVI